MAESDVTVRIRTVDEGSGKMRQFADSVKDVNRGIGDSQKMWKNVAVGVGAVGVAFGAAAIAAKKAWDIMGEGAALLRTQARFEKLSESIGTTANVLTARLRAATHGTISDMKLMADASQLISLRLADNADQVVRLGAVAGTLNWDMQQVILTFANMSVMRLDALGLSVSDVTSKARELELQGMSSQEAFKEAVILAGEAQKALLDVGNDAVRNMEQAQAGWQNATNSFKMGLANLAEESGVTSALSGIGNLLSEIGMSKAEKEIKATANAMAFFNQQTAEGKMLATALQAQNFMGATGAGPNALGVTADMSDTEAQIAMLTQVRAQYADNAEAVGMLDAELSKLNETLAEQERKAALAAAGGRQLADVYTEWATATKVQGEQAENFLKAFNESISSATGSIDTGPLISLGSELEGVGVRAGAMTINVDAANMALYEAAQAAGASASELALLGAATGMFTEAEADAALKTAILQEAIKYLAIQYSEGKMSIQAVTDELREQMAVIAGMPSMFAAASQSARQLGVLTGQSGGSNGPWYRPTGPLIKRDVEEVEKATRAYGGFTQQVDALAEARNRFTSAFSAELTAKIEDGLIGADGLVNIERMNEAMMEQAKAAGMSATQLALLGVATGQYTEEQAAAALKAAVLQERIAQLAKGIVTGQMSMQDALGNLDAFRQNLDAAQPGEGGLQNTVAQIVSSLPEGDRTIEFLSDTGLVDDDIMRLQSTVVDIPVRFIPTNSPTFNNSTSVTRSSTTDKRGPTKIDVNMTFNGATDQAAVKNGMDAWTRELRREGVPI